LTPKKKKQLTTSLLYFLSFFFGFSVQVFFTNMNWSEKKKKKEERIDELSINFLTIGLA
jgi:predicted membrane channel-forming protein YqfA (hemolysin III family)